jgi:hypothetical protein
MAWMNTLPRSVRSSCDLLSAQWEAAFYSERFYQSLDRAREWMRRCPADPDRRLGMALSAAAVGRRATADSALAVIDPRAPGPEAIRLTSHFALRAAARVAAFFGERERAVALLREALRRNGWFVANLDFDIPLERLRGYAPYDELRRPRD